MPLTTRRSSKLGIEISPKNFRLEQSYTVNTLQRAISNQLARNTITSISITITTIIIKTIIIILQTRYF
jgi:hypothetical protein